MTTLDRDQIFLIFALTECSRALHAMDEVERLARIRTQVESGVERREFQAVFDYIRLALQFSAGVSKIFWPPTIKASQRGVRLRALTGLADEHSLAHRRLRNHIEHLDERMDDWTEVSPRPFLSAEFIFHDDYPQFEMRKEAINACAVVYDAHANSVIVFGEVFLLDDLRHSVSDVLEKCSKALSKI